jgi:hypothetical protein
MSNLWHSHGHVQIENIILNKSKIYIEKLCRFTWQILSFYPMYIRIYIIVFNKLLCTLFCIYLCLYTFVIKVYKSEIIITSKLNMFI